MDFTKMKTGLTVPIAAALVLSFLFVSCAATPGPADAVSQIPETSGSAAGEKVTDKTNVLTLFEKEDFAGRIFRVICASDFNSAIRVPQSPDFEIFGDSVNDALIERQYKIEDYYNVSFDYFVDKTDGDICTTLRSLIAAQEDAYDLALASMAYAAYPLALERSVRDMNAIEEIDLTRDWWNKNIIKDLGIGGKVFFATGDITNRSVTAISGYAFNMKLFGDYGIEYPYGDVYDGKWTLEKMSSVYKDRARDLNGDGKYTCDNDLVPLHTGGYINYFSAGGRITDKDPEGTVIPVYSSEKNISLMDSVLDYFTGSDILFNTGYAGVSAFKENRAIFVYLAGCDLSLLRDMEDDYGFVPFPKKDESQSDYITSGNQWITTCAMIPVTVPEDSVHFAGKMTETMAAVSRYTSIAAKYDILLLEKELRDNESKDMVRLCSETMSFDLGKLADIGGIAGIIEDTFTSQKEFVSRYESAKAKAESDLEKLLTAIG